MYLTACLVTTDLKDSVVMNMNWASTITFVVSFIKKVLEKWKEGVWSSVEKKNWNSLIVYHMCSSNCQIIRLHSSVTTVKLQNPKIMIPDVALGIPIKQSMLHFPPFYCTMMLISHLSFALSQRMVHTNDLTIFYWLILSSNHDPGLEYLVDAYKALLTVTDEVHPKPIYDN
jgi:hypothetical protein